MKIVGSPLVCMCNASHTRNLEKKTKYNTLAVYWLKFLYCVATIMDKVDEKFQTPSSPRIDTDLRMGKFHLLAFAPLPRFILVDLLAWSYGVGVGGDQIKNILKHCIIDKNFPIAYLFF